MSEPTEPWDQSLIEQLAKERGELARRLEEALERNRALEALNETIARERYAAQGEAKTLRAERDEARSELGAALRELATLRKAPKKQSGTFEKGEKEEREPARGRR